LRAVSPLRGGVASLVKGGDQRNGEAAGLGREHDGELRELAARAGGRSSSSVGSKRMEFAAGAVEHAALAGP